MEAFAALVLLLPFASGFTIAVMAIWCGTNGRMPFVGLFVAALWPVWLPFWAFKVAIKDRADLLIARRFGGARK